MKNSEIESVQKEQEKIWAKERMLSTLMANLPGMAYRCLNDKFWTMQFVSEGCQSLTGCLPSDLINNEKLSFAELIHPEDRDYVERAVKRAVLKKESFEIEYRLFTVDGQEKWVWEKGEGIPDSNGNVQTLEGFITDISYRKLSEESVRRERDFSNAILDTAGALIVVVDRNGCLVHFNRACMRISGYSLEEVHGKPIWDVLLLPDETERVKKEFEKLVAGVKVKESEYHWKGKLGEIYLINWANTVLMGGNSQVEYVVSIGIDITEKRQTEEDLIISEQKYRDLVETSRDAIFRSSPDGKFLELNPVGCRLFGFNLKDIKKVKIISLYSFQKDRKRYIQEISKNGFVEDFQVDLKKTDGTVFPASISAVAVKDMTGKVAHFQGSIRDMSERKHAEEKIKSSLAEKEILLKEIHHRVKNNMQIISSLLNLQARQTNSRKAIDILKESQNRIYSMALVHEELYQSHDFENINFHDYIQHLVMNIYQSYLQQQKPIDIQLDVKDVALGIDLAIPCGLIINELLTNAIKYAFPEGWQGEPRITIKLHQKENEQIELMVKDNGIGIPDGFNLNKTKSLGMYLVRVLTEEQLNGKISVNGKLGCSVRLQFQNR